MKLSIGGFRGEIPVVGRQLLPDGYAEQAINARLVSGRLESWKNLREVTTACKLAPINTIFPLRDPVSGNVAWLTWRDSEVASGATNVDVAKSIIAGDTTARIYMTGLDVPRWTNYTLATSGSGCPPVQTRPIGVIAPTVAPTVSGTTVSTSPIDVSDDFENDAGWTFSPIIDSNPNFRIARRLPTLGNPNGRLQYQLGGGQAMAYAFRNFNVGSSSTVTIEFDYRLDQRFADEHDTEALWSPKAYQFFGVFVMCDENGAGGRVSWEPIEPPPGSVISGRSGTSLSQHGAQVSAQSTSALPPLGQWVRVKLTGTKQSGGTYSWRIVITLGSTDIIDATVTGIPANGGYCGLFSPASLSGHGVQVQSVDNFRITASAPPIDTSDDVTTSYVYTYVADAAGNMEESAPSPPSDIIVRNDGETVTVTTPTSPPTGLDYNIVAKRIYRAVTGASGTDFWLVDEIPLSQATYNDSKLDRVVVLGDILRSADWDLPPSDMRGIIALPNGIMAGFRKNELCLSEQGFPHAWPVKYRLATDFDIVGIGAIDTSVVICTKGFPYVAFGNQPGSYSMSKIELPQACVSKRSIAYVSGIGVLYASPDGIVSIAGPGKAALITGKVFSRQEWQALNPSSIIASAHDNRYIGFYDTGTTKGGFILDLSESGFGVVMLSLHATAVAPDLIDDRLYMVLDYNAPPAPAGSPASGQAVPDGRKIFAFDDHQGGPLSPKLPYKWKSKQYVLPYPATFRYARVVAEEYADATIELADNDQVFASIEVTGNKEFVLPSVSGKDGTDRFSVTVYGTSRIARMEFAEDVSELD